MKVIKGKFQLHPNAKDLTGRRFDRLLALAPTPIRKTGRSVVWKCLCDCGNIAYISSYELQHGNTKSCGCLRREFFASQSGRQSGIGNPNWKGGRTKTPEGYIQIRVHNHPHATTNGYVMEHRLVMEKYLERYLSPLEVVHHCNGVKDDNRIENLMLFNSGIDHTKFHALTAAVIAVAESEE